MSPLSLSDLPKGLGAIAIDLAKRNPHFRAWLQDRGDAAFYNFKPRPNDPKRYDEQEAFVNSQARVSFLIGGNACLAPDSIIVDPADGSRKPIADRQKPFYVESLDIENNQRAWGYCPGAFRKGRDTLYRVSLSNGQQFTATAGHRVLRQGGDWRKVQELVIGDWLMDITAWPAMGGRVSNIEAVGEGDYWDLTVWPWHNYVHAGVVHHNSGTTTAGCAKLANVVLRTHPPPRRNAPFWIVSNTYEQVCATIWDEKLFGQGFIPEVEIDTDKIHWLSKKDNWPLRVPLKPWPKHPGRNWVLEFKSFEQGRSALQARSVCGAFLSEQFPLSVFLEILRGARDYQPGGNFWAEFTPIDPELCLWVEKLMKDPPKGWEFFRCNTELNKPNLADGWFDSFFESVPDEMRETRMTGALSTFEGVIYSGFNPAWHVIPADEVEFPQGIRHLLGVDWGAGKEHPFACVWCYRDSVGKFVFYDEYYSTDQTATVIDHAEAIKARCREWGWPVDEDEQGSFINRILGARGPTLYGPAFADPSRPTDLNLFNRGGIPTVAAVNSVLPGIDCVRAKLKPIEGVGPRLVISDRCERLIEEIRKYRWKRGATALETKARNPSAPPPEPVKVDDHLVDATRYVIYTYELSSGAKIASDQTASYIEQKKSIQLSRLTGGPNGRRSRNGNGNGNGHSHVSRPGWFIKGG